MRSCSVDYVGIKIQDNIATFETFSMYTLSAVLFDRFHDSINRDNGWLYLSNDSKIAMRRRCYDYLWTLLMLGLSVSSNSSPIKCIRPRICF